MGKGDKKSRRGKIVIGSTGVRRPKPSSKNSIKASGIAPVEEIKKGKKEVEKVKAEPKIKAKAPEAVITKDSADTPKKVVKKATKKTKIEDEPAKE